VLSGIVTTATGEPVADARVVLATGPGDRPDVAALTQPDGTFSFGAVVPGRYRVEAFSDLARADAYVDVSPDADESVNPGGPVVLVFE
ncbi:MAG: carboxypeptidase-like regulatory domain-containing protein, partial [Ornithinimicrobium sp.]